MDQKKPYRKKRYSNYNANKKKYYPHNYEFHKKPNLSINQFLALNELIGRAQLAAKLGMQYGTDRDVYQALGYPTDKIEYSSYAARYLRQDIARAVIDRPVNATWRGKLDIVESDDDKDTLLEKEWKALEDNEVGMMFPDTHQHNTQVTLSGITFARTMEIINGYTVTFEDGQYVLNLYGANHNILDVANANQVSLRANLSGGLIVAGSGVTEQDMDDIVDKIFDEPVTDHEDSGSFGESIINAAKLLGYKVTKSGDVITIYEANGVDIWRQYNLADGGRVQV